MNRVVVGVHDSLAGLCARRQAVTEARRRGAILHAVRAWPLTPGTRVMAVQPWRSVAVQEATVAVQQAFDDAMGGVPDDVTVHVMVTAGPPGAALVEYADRADDLLVVGAGQRRWLRRLVGSSVARYCVRHAHCPVLAVPPPELAQAGSISTLARALRREVQQLVDTSGTG